MPSGYREPALRLQPPLRRWANTCHRLLSITYDLPVSQPADSNPARARWLAFAARRRCRRPAETFQHLATLYQTPPRAYHNLSHILACLDLLSEFRHVSTDIDAAEAALWFHDCIYTPGRPDNEARSAQVASEMAADLGFDQPARDQIASWILATRHTTLPASATEALILDIDMSILGANPADYDAYAAAIRTEFSFVSDAEFAAGRAKFLRGLLARPAIYFLPEFAMRFHLAARSNITRELSRWEPASTANPA